jgi:hypothetical protein
MVNNALMAARGDVNTPPPLVPAKAGTQGQQLLN